MSAANSAARKRPRTPGQQPKAVEDEAVQKAGAPASPEPGGPEENGSGVHADAEASRAEAGLDRVNVSFAKFGMLLSTNEYGTEPVSNQLAYCTGDEFAACDV